MMNVLSMTRGQMQVMVNESMAIEMPIPEMALLRDEMLEFLLRLWEIKELATQAIEKRSQVDPGRLIELLDGKRS